MPEAFIQDGLTVDDNERAVITKYGFELRFVEGSTSEMILTDPAIRDSGDPDKASNSGEDLEKLLRGAVDNRKAFEEATGEKVPTKPAGKIKAAKLNNEGAKAARTKKTKEPKVRKDNRYLRASRVIVENVTISVADLSKGANMSPATAGHCTEAWKGVTLALKEKGWLTKAALDILFPKPAPAPKADKPAAKGKTAKATA